MRLSASEGSKRRFGAMLVAAFAVAFALATSCGGTRRPVEVPGAREGATSCGGPSWLREILSGSSASVVGIAATADGGVVTAVNVHRKVVIQGDGKPLGSVVPDAPAAGLVVRFSADGRLVWMRHLGAAGSRVTLGGLAIRADGTIAVGGVAEGAPVAKGDGKVADIPFPAVSGVGGDHPKRIFVALYESEGAPRKVVVTPLAGTILTLTALAASQNDVIVGGLFSKELTFGSGARAIKLVSTGILDDGFVARFDANGDAVWARRIGGAEFDMVTTLAVAPSGSLFVGGIVRQNSPEKSVTFADRPEPLALVGGKQDAFLAELDRDGQLSWWEAVGGDESKLPFAHDGVTGIVPTADGDVLVLGNSTLPLRFGRESAPLAVPELDQVPFLARVARGGRARWVLPLGNGTARDLAALPDGDVVVTAEAEDSIRYLLSGPAQTTFTSAGLKDMLLARHAPDGTLRWVARFGGDETELGAAVTTARNGAIFASGRSYGDFRIERAHCPPLAMHGAGGGSLLNSFVLRVAPGENPNDPDRERRLAERKAEVARLRKGAADATRAGDDVRACTAYAEVTKLVHDEPAAWLDLGDCEKRAASGEALSAYYQVLVVASRYRGVILAEHEAARKKAYRALAELDQSVALPKSGCKRLEAAPGCKVSLFACSGTNPMTREDGVRIATTEEQAQLEEYEFRPVAPSLGSFALFMTADRFESQHHWFQRADSMDVLLSTDDTECKLVVANACLGLVATVCDTRSDDGSEPTKTVDEFYLWRPDDNTVAPDPKSH